MVRRHQGKMSTSSVLHPGRYWDSWTLTSTLACLTSLHFFSPYALQQRHRYLHQPVTPHFTHTATPAVTPHFTHCNTSLSHRSTHCSTSLSPHSTQTATPVCHLTPHTLQHQSVTSLHTHCNTSLSPHSTHCNTNADVYTSLLQPTPSPHTFSPTHSGL